MRYLRHLKNAFAELRTNRVLIYLTVYGLVLSGIFGNLEEFDQLYYHLVHLPLYAFGLAFFVWSSSNALGSYYAHRLKGCACVFYLLPALSAVALIVVGRFPSLPMIALLLFSYFLSSPLNVLIESRVQNSIRSESRATVTSGISFLQNTGLFLVLLGAIGKLWNLQAIYLAAGIILLAFAPLGLRRQEQNKRERGARRRGRPCVGTGMSACLSLHARRFRP